MGAQRSEPVGALLAGGRGRRIGGDKAITELAGRPLISYPLRAMRAVLREVVIVAKLDTALPELAGVEVWTEPALPRHPLVGICHALRMAGGRPVLICAADLPFITAFELARLARADPGHAPAVIAVSPNGELQPLLGCYQPAAAAALQTATREAVAPLRRAVGAIEPRLLEIADARTLFNINSPQDLDRAERLISRT